MSIAAELFSGAAEKRSRTLLAYANPHAGEGLLALPGAELEAKTITSSDPSAILRVGADASEATFVKEVAQFATIHLAAHAKVDELDPLYSSIFLAPGDGSDGVLEAHEVYELNLSGADLVTLSACETGLGRIGKGDEQWGFIRTFLAAGARSTLASLWKVEDVATQKLMQKVYKELRLGTGKAMALHRAQLEMLRNPKYSSPLFWAGFSLWGEL
jgi:CHAT domain-containing protein